MIHPVQKGGGPTAVRYPEAKIKEAFSSLTLEYGIGPTSYFAGSFSSDLSMCTSAKTSGGGRQHFRIRA
jgi:hypothetical protein